MSGATTPPSRWRGARVRVRLTRQCRWDRGGGPVGHDGILHGQLGTVVEVDRQPLHDLHGHYYYVQLDACPCGQPREPDAACYEWFEARELERLARADGG